jgi:putative aldouronate transport system permease protein
VITYSLITSLFSVNTGSINNLLMNNGLITRGINLLGSSKYSWGLIISLNTWKYAGYNCVIFLSTLSGIPHEEYEAADLDGANRFQKIRYITIPNIVPTLCVLLIINSGWILTSNLEQFFIFTNGTNWETMEVLDMYIYKFGLKLLRFSFATAIGIVKSVISVLMVITVNQIVKKLNDTSIF